MFKLNSKGFSHHLVIAVVVLVVGVGGTYILVKSHADQLCPKPVTSTGSQTCSSSSEITCTLDMAATLYNNVNANPTYTLTNGSASATGSPSGGYYGKDITAHLSIYKGSESVGNRIDYNSSSNETTGGVTIPNSLSPGATYTGNSETSFFETGFTSTTPLVAVLSGSMTLTNSSGVNEGTYIFGCSKAVNIVVDQGETYLAGSWGNYGTPSITTTNDGSVKNVLEIPAYTPNDGYTGGFLGADESTIKMAVEDNGQQMKVCIEARADIPSSSSQLYDLDFSLGGPVNTVIFHARPGVGGTYGSRCFTFTFTTLHGTIPAGDVPALSGNPISNESGALAIALYNENTVPIFLQSTTISRD